MKNYKFSFRCGPIIILSVLMSNEQLGHHETVKNQPRRHNAHITQLLHHSESNRATHSSFITQAVICREEFLNATKGLKLLNSIHLLDLPMIPIYKKPRLIRAIYCFVALLIPRMT